MKYKDFVYGIMAGVVVGFGGIIKLSVANETLGAFLFAGALFIILSLEYNYLQEWLAIISITKEYLI